MRWFLIFNPVAGLKLLLLAICVVTIGCVLAVNVLMIELNDANGSKHTIASDPEHVYFPRVRNWPASPTNESCNRVR
jgi:hypothetical protein